MGYFKKYLFAIGAVMVATAAFFLNRNELSTDAKYEQKELNTLDNQSASDAFEWLNARFLDPETGEKISGKRLRQIEQTIRSMKQSRGITFIENGPDNIGGRTRAIQIDKTNNNIIWAGGVSGGLFKSTNAAQTWEIVDTYEVLGSPFISSMAQFDDGTLFVATGFNNFYREAFSGDGLWYTTDAGQTWQLVPGTASYDAILEVVAPEGGNTIWFAAGSDGLKKWTFGDASVTDVDPAAGSCGALQCSADGSVFVAAFGSSRTYVSTDGGNNWTDKSTEVQPGAQRIEYAISQGLNSSGNYSIYAVRTASNLIGMNVSHDSGNTWSEFVGSSGTPSNLDIYRDQGDYNSIVTVSPQNPEKILIGGIDIWKWEQTSNNPPSGGFEALTQWFLAPSSPKYAHADQHEMKWDGNKLYVGNDGGIGITYDPELAWYPANRGYNVTQFYGIAFDRHGAVMGGTQDNGSLYNDHSLSTWEEFRQVSGGDGFQCEISFYNPSVMFTTSQFGAAFRSGDGGNTMSFFVPDTIGTLDPFGTQGNNHPFHTRIFMAEHYDTNSQDSILFIPDQDYASGAEISVPSAATGDTILYTLTSPLYYNDTVNYTPGLSVTETSVVNAITGQNIFLDLYNWSHWGTSGSGQNPPLVGDSLIVDFPTGTDTVVVQSTGTYIHYYAQHPVSGQVYDMGVDSVVYNLAWNTITVQDPYQSWYFMYVNANGGELWGTRNALRLSSTDPKWGVVAQGIGGGEIDIEFSRDLNNIFVSSSSGTIRRIEGLGSLYTSDPQFESKAFWKNGTPPSVTNVTPFSITGGGTCEGLALNPNDADDLVVFMGFAGNNIRRSSNATSGSPTFTNVGNITGASPGTYDGIIDRNDPNILVVGTSHGVFVTENGGASWEDASAGFRGTPVFEVRQSWRTFAEGNFRPGEIYIGTFGRGIWSSASYLNVDDIGSGNGSDDIEVFQTNLSTYPNPTSSSTTVKFDLESTQDVNVRIYSLSGRLIKVIDRKNMAAGTNTIHIDGQDISRGTYIVKLVAGSQRANTKFIKM